MVVLILESVQPSVRGELTRWLLELHAGVFVGNVSAMVRDKLWEMVCARMRGKCGGMLVHTSAGEQGYAIRTYGTTTRQIVDFDGLYLAGKPAKEQKTKKSRES